MNPRTTAAALLMAALTLTACGQQDTTTNNDAQAADTTEQSVATDGSVKMNVPLQAGDLIFTATNTQDGFDFGRPIELPGFRYVAVETTVQNQGQREIDLSCGLDVETTLLDQNGNGFGIIDHLEEVPGNPACGDMLIPGDEKQITWVYKVPDDFQPATFWPSDVDNEDYTMREIRLR